MNIPSIFFIFIVFIRKLNAEKHDLNIDKNGYILYCPCMGRFGNQADHFLGALGFAHGLNRTLVLPPWVEYVPRVPRSKQVPFDVYFKVEALEKFHRVMTMENFMEKIADIIWPADNRIAFCYTARYNSTGCNPKDGNPFGPFWDNFQVDFVGSEFYGPKLNYDVYHRAMGQQWNEKYSPEKWPVLAFTGAPASFPVQNENLKLQKFLQWNDDILSKSQTIISSFPKGPFVAIHLRNGGDWLRACEHVHSSSSLFASPQCLGYRREFGSVTYDLCFPSKEIIIKQLKRVIKNISATSVFVSSDNDHMIEFLSQKLAAMKVKVQKMGKPNLHVELAVMEMANHFIGNCISTVSAFVKRARDVKGLPSSFWAFPTPSKKIKHTEL